MTYFSPETLLLLFLSANLTALIGLILYSKDVKLQVASSQKDRVLWKCEFCLHRYLAEKTTPHARCPECNSLNFKIDLDPHLQVKKK